MPSSISGLLLRWHNTHQKSFPFRITNDPYRILVCEMLLRQTTGEQVARIYYKFFDRFPTVMVLAQAKPSEILDVIRPLGIHRRAKELSQLSRAITERHDGVVPCSYEDLTNQNGVGRYVANCVLAFAFNKKVPLVDVNTERVLCRFLGLRQNKGAPRQEIWEAYSSLAPTRNLRLFHYALIDFSHMICRPVKPKCLICPLATSCKEYVHKRRRHRT